MNEQSQGVEGFSSTVGQSQGHKCNATYNRGTLCRGRPGIYSCLPDKQETFLSVEIPWHLFLLSLTAAARMAAKVFEERAGRMEGKGDF